jgi:antitoxin PrlF
MYSNTADGEVIRVSKKGQATIPKELRERFGIETPGKVFIYEAEGKIVVEPLPSVEEMQGVHAGRYETGEVLGHLREMKEKDEQLERAGDERLDRQQ